ncbi:hypothetical protein ACP70R_025172 [Stipagrostis hirtigluma subsp. patula]
MAGWERRGRAPSMAAFMQCMAAGMGMTGGMSSEAMDQIKRVIATSDCDRSRTMGMFLTGSFAKLGTEEMFESMNVKSEEMECDGPLHDAASKGKMDTCKHLVEHLGFDVDSVASDGSGLTPLSCAVSHGKAIAVRYFLDKGADPNKQDHKGFAPLHYAAKQGFDGMARLLLSRGACVDLPSSEGTPLHVAASCGKPGVMQILLEHKADPDMVSVDLCTPLTAVICACTMPGKVDESVCLKCMKLLVKAGADVNCTNPDTPLVIATSKGLAECVTYLLEVSADANIPIKHDGSTPIEIAAESGRRNLVEILFPFTNRIKAVSDWSVEGIVAHAKSIPSKEKDKASVDDRKAELKLLGGKAVARKDYAGASRFYKEAIELDPADATLYSNRSFCLLKIGDAEDALFCANACIRLQPEWIKGYYRKGAALMSLKEYKEACDAFMDGLKLDPSNVDLQNAYWEAAEAMRKEHSAGRSASTHD